MNINVGKKIKELRAAKNITQAEMAQRIGMTSSTISSYEVGERQPSYDVLIKIARLFNVTTDTLLGHTNKDMMNMSGLLPQQRQSIQKMVETYQKFNELCIAMFDMKKSMDEDDYNTFLEHLDAALVDDIKMEISRAKAKKNNF